MKVFFCEFLCLKGEVYSRINCERFLTKLLIHESFWHRVYNLLMIACDSYTLYSILKVLKVGTHTLQGEFECINM